MRVILKTSLIFAFFILKTYEILRTCYDVGILNCQYKGAQKGFHHHRNYPDHYRDRYSEILMFEFEFRDILRIFHFMVHLLSGF